MSVCVRRQTGINKLLASKDEDMVQYVLFLYLSLSISKIVHQSLW